MIFQPQRGMQEVSYIWYRAPSTLYMGKGTSVWDHIIKFEIFHFLGTLRYDGCMDNLFSHSFYQNNIIEREYLQKYLIHFFLKQHISPFPCLLKKCIFSKKYLDTIGPFSYASSHILLWMACISQDFISTVVV